MTVEKTEAVWLEIRLKGRLQIRCLENPNRCMETIALLLAQSENSRLLWSFLSSHYQLKSREQSYPLFGKIDLLIVDGLMLQQYQNEIRERVAQEHPLCLPVLLITHRQLMHRVTQSLWQVIDDVLIMPIEKRELLTRIETLLRSRRLSLALKTSQTALAHSQSTIEELEAEITSLNRLFKQAPLPTTVDKDS